jgi:DNA-damage-inducible protein J
MAGVTSLNIKIDRDLKTEADKLFSDMGMNLTAAVNVFIRQAVREQAIPFRNERRQDAVQSADRRYKGGNIREGLFKRRGN